MKISLELLKFKSKRAGWLAVCTAVVVKGHHYQRQKLRQFEEENISHRTQLTITAPSACPYKRAAAAAAAAAVTVSRASVEFLRFRFTRTAVMPASCHERLQQRQRKLN